ncbi:MAG: WD40 repeat domain-containing protein [Planctomycetes bacterium]|nr:WD40 repeat domain-containing protein [Planctomycetota bacterium]
MRCNGLRIDPIGTAHSGPRGLAWVAMALILAGQSCFGPPCRGQSASDWTSREIPLAIESARATRPVVTGLAVDGAGYRIAAAGDDHLVRVWNRETGGLEWLVNGHTDWVRAVAFTPDGAYLASTGNDRRIIVWNMADGKPFRELGPFSGALAAVRFSEDGEWIAGVGYEMPLTVLRWRDGADRRELACPCQDMRTLAFSPDGAHIAAAGRSGEVRVWSLATGEVVDRYVLHRQRVRAVLFAGDANTVYSAGDDRRVYVARVGDGDNRRVLVELDTKIQSLTRMDPWIVAGCADNSIRLLHGETGKEVARLDGHAGTVSALDALPGQIFSGSYDTTVRVWKITSETAVSR